MTPNEETARQALKDALDEFERTECDGLPAEITASRRVGFVYGWPKGVAHGMETAAQIAADEYVKIRELRSRPYVSDSTFKELACAGRCVNTVEIRIRSLAAPPAKEDERA